MKKLLTISITWIAMLHLAAAQSAFTVSEKPLRKMLAKSYPNAKLELAKSLALGQYYKISDTNKLLAFAYAGRVNSCRASGCSTPNNKTESSMEYFDYYALFNTQQQIIKLSIFNYQATHGQAVCSSSWLKQFLHYDGSKALAVGHNIDAISGATISTESFTNDIQTVTKQLKLIK